MRSSLDADAMQQRIKRRQAAIQRHAESYVAPAPALGYSGPVAAENVRNTRVTGATANQGVPLAAARTVVISVTVVALDSNTDKVAVGGIDTVDASATAQSAPLLSAGDSLSFGAVDLNDVHIAPRVAGEGVAILWEE